MPGPIGEAKVEENATRIRLPRAVRLYLKLEGGENIEFLAATTDLAFEELADNSVILHVKRTPPAK